MERSRFLSWIVTYFPRIRNDLNAKVLPKEICKYDQVAVPRQNLSPSKPILSRLKSPSLEYSGGDFDCKGSIHIIL